VIRRKRNRTTLGILCLCLILTPTAPLAAQENQKIIWVAHYKTDCVGVGPQQCYLIKDNMYDPWKLWYDEIDRLDWEEGFAYEVVVVEEPVPNPAADQPSVRLRVVELLTMINAESQPEGALPVELQDLPPQGQSIETASVTTETVAVEETVATDEVVAVEEVANVTEDTIGIDPTTQMPESEIVVSEQVAAPVPAPAAKPAPPAESKPVAEVAPKTPETQAIPTVSPPAPKPAPEPPVDAATSRSQPPTAPPLVPRDEAQTFRGHLTIGVGLETRTFKICGAESPIWIEDRSDDNLWRTYRDLSGYPNRPVFLVVEGDLGPAPASGFGAHYEQALTVIAVRQAATEGPGCSEEVGNLDFIAFGNEPFWQVQISAGGIVYSEAGGADWIFPYKEPMATDTRRVYWGASEDGSNHKIQITIEEKPCSDTMADAQYSFTAAVTIDDRQLSGCARVGRR